MYHRTASFCAFQSVLFAKLQGNLADEGFWELDSFSVVGHKAVELIFYIAQLRIHAGAQALFLRGDDLRLVEFAEGLAKRCAVPEGLIAEALVTPCVAGDGEGVAAELRERDGSMKLVRLKMIRAEVDVQALKLPNFLIVPAAGVVNDAGVIELLNVRRRVCRVELPPALVEGDPRADARAAVELGPDLNLS
ncbi:MAG: hypothetical protein ACLR8U_09470 [Oscillospiraceae bacterium]